MADKNDREERIRARAHALWERQGRPEGHDEEHWHQAAREIDNSDGNTGVAPADTTNGIAPGGTHNESAQRPKPPHEIVEKQ